MEREMGETDPKRKFIHTTLERSLEVTLISLRRRPDEVPVGVPAQPPRGAPARFPEPRPVRPIEPRPVSFGSDHSTRPIEKRPVSPAITLALAEPVAVREALR